MDCLIVGSDQVWRYKYAKDSITDYFGGFLPALDNITKFSYAASFGVDYEEYPLAFQRKCGELLKCFEGISVREPSAITLLEKDFGVQKGKTVVVVDPTLLLRREVYYTLIEKAVSQIPQDFIFSYVLDATAEIQEIQEEINDSLSLQCVSFRAQTGDIKDIEVIEPVEKWLAHIAKASFVVTDSFHGTVFSILFNRPFVVVANIQRGITRIDALLNHYGLQDRILSSYNKEQIKSIIPRPIDWDGVNNQIIKDRADSLTFLKGNMSS